MALLAALQTSPTLLLIVITILGLLIGSFLNVVAYRLPLRIEQDFRNACRDSFGAPDTIPGEQLVSLIRPGSQCPHCRTPIKPWHNLPVAGWLMLRGKCAACAAPISVQYPIVEALTGLMSAVCALHFGATPQLLGALVLTWSLIALTVTDLRTMYLPDDLTLPLLWLALVLSLWGVFATPSEAIIGAALGYGLLWGTFHLFKFATGKEGMGYGDFKLLAALGAWLGWQALPQIVLLSAMVGAAVGIVLIVSRRAEWSSRIPFGPYIAGAGWIALIWGERINQAYLGLIQPH
ncbi:MAG: Type 4 prepilin-like protein leader peptide-processing enzyme [Hydrocarboniphaga sp.]|uniref:prepilin peptidase n=1 Tax=Hydrocarboniphaga sp. TaxID=2033016 RepID=UPI00261FD67B|nr:A24 family peptidase [Hydrocarboniphaga sp.]MDB5971934.1 Type 4 prepilin-like protein leader peptide-processing enzyme [Hydrocarboniphaga sp.]